MYVLGQKMVLKNDLKMIRPISMNFMQDGTGQHAGMDSDAEITISVITMIVRNV